MTSREFEIEYAAEGWEFGRWEWVGAALLVLLFLGALISNGYAVDGIERAIAFALCGLFGGWGALSIGIGRYRPRRWGPAVFAALAMGLVTVMAGLYAAPIPTGLARVLSPPWRETFEAMEAAGVALPDTVTLGLSPENARSGFLQAVASLGFLIGVLALAARRRGALILVIVICCFSLLQGWIGALISALEGLGRTTGIFYNPNHHAASTLAGLPLAGAFFLWMRERGEDGFRLGGGGDRSVFLAAVWFIALAGWLAAMSRGSLLFSLPVLIGWTGWEAWVRWRGAASSSSRDGRKGLWMEVGLVLAAFVVIVALSPVVGPYIDRLAPEADVTRIAFWKATMAGFLETRGLGLGTGAAEYAISMHLDGVPARKTAVYSHNDWVQFVAEFGLAGALGTLVLALCFTRSVVAHYRAEIAAVGWEGLIFRRACAVGLIMLLGHALVDFHLRMPAIGFQALALLALLSGRGLRWIEANE